MRNRYFGISSLSPGGRELGVGSAKGLALGKACVATWEAALTFRCVRIKKSQVGGEDPTNGRGGLAPPLCGFPVFQKEKEAAGVIVGCIYQSHSAREPPVCPHFPCTESQSPGCHLPSALHLLLRQSFLCETTSLS